MVTLTLCRGLWRALQEKVAKVWPCMQLHFQYSSPPNYYLQGKQCSQGNHRWSAGWWGTAYKETYFDNTQKKQPWHPVKHHYEATHFMRWRKNPQINLFSSGNHHVLPRMSTKGTFSPQHLRSRCSISFCLFLFALLFPVLYECESHRLPGNSSDFPLTSTAPPLTILFISLIYSFIICTLHLSSYFLLSQTFSNAISILRSIAPPKDL